MLATTPGCDAKPIVDLLVGVREWPAPAALRDALVSLGYEDLDEAGVTGRIYLRARGRPGTGFNLAVTVDGPLWRTNLAVRELLRGDPELVRAYAAEKRGALRAGCTGLLAYSEHKAGFLRVLVSRAFAAG